MLRPMCRSVRRIGPRRWFAPAKGGDVRPGQHGSSEADTLRPAGPVCGAGIAGGAVAQVGAEAGRAAGRKSGGGRPGGGTMTSDPAPAPPVAAALAGDAYVQVSAYNGLNTVISGPVERL